MKNSNKNPALSKAISFLTSLISQPDSKIGQRLPTCRELALQANVSFVTMVKAVNHLKKQGILTAKQKSGIIIGNIKDKAPNKEAPVIVPKWQHIRETIRHDIMSGHLHNKEHLPGIKELNAHYKTGFNTLKKAIDSLVKDGFVHSDKRKYRIEKFSHRKHGSTIYLVMAEVVHTGIMWSVDRDWLNELTRALEKECSQYNINLVKISYSRSWQLRSDMDPPSNIQGFIILNHNWNWDTEGNDEMFKTLDYFLRYKKTMVLLTMVGIHFFENEYIERTRNYCTRNKIFMSNLSSDFQAGRQVGRFLYSKGHREICFFTSSRDWIWQHRYQGIQKEFELLGLQNAIHELCAGIPSGLKHPEHDHSKKETQLANQLSLERSALENGLASVEKIQGYPFFIPRLKLHFFELLNGLTLREKFEPWFQKALSLKNVTAWVCAEDYIANFAALEFLKSEKVAVPGKVGLIGFNDQMESSFNGISSYHFNFAGAALKALSCILYPRHATLPDNSSNPYSFNVDGMVIDRGSV